MNRFKSLLALLVLTATLVGCGTNNSEGDNGAAVFGPQDTRPPAPSTRSVVVRLSGADRFPSTVTSFRARLLTNNTISVVAEQTAARGAQTSLTFSFADLQSAQFVLSVESLDSTGRTISYNIQGVVPPAEVFLSDSNFTTGTLPQAPFAVPSPTPPVLPSPSPGASPVPSPIGSPFSSPRPSP